MYLSKFQEFKIYIVHFTDLARDALHLYTGLLVFFIALFQSDLMHEVIQAKHQRLSITAWLRSGNHLF